MFSSNEGNKSASPYLGKILVALKQARLHTYYTGEVFCILADMEKGPDAQTLTAEISEKCGKFRIVEDYLL